MKRLNSDVPRQSALARLYLAQSDFRAALKAVRLIIERVKTQYDELFEPLETAAVVSYVRPFCDGRSHKRISAGRYERFDKAEFQQLHRFLITHRHEVAAHSNENAFAVSVIPPNVSVPPSVTVSWDGEVRGTIASAVSIESRSIKLEVYPIFKALCELQLKRVSTHIADAQLDLSANEKANS